MAPVLRLESTTPDTDDEEPQHHDASGGAGVRAWLYLAGAIVTEVTGTLALRASVDAAAWVAVVVVSYIGAFTLLGMALRQGLPIGVAYGIWGAIGVALVALLGIVLFDELLSVTALIGIGCIIAGVALVETGARHRPAREGPAA